MRNSPSRDRPVRNSPLKSRPVGQKRSVRVARRRPVVSEPVGSGSIEFDGVLPRMSRTPSRIGGEWKTTCENVRRGRRTSIAPGGHASASRSGYCGPRPASPASSEDSECRIGYDGVE